MSESFNLGSVLGSVFSVLAGSLSSGEGMLGNRTYSIMLTFVFLGRESHNVQLAVLKYEQFSGT